MRLLLLHADWVEFEPKLKALEDAEKIEEGRRRIEEVLVVYTTVEEKDNLDTVRQAKMDIIDVMNKVAAKRVLIYPWAHLSSKLAPPKKALKLVKELEKELRAAGIEVYRAPFGWYKAFAISVKGHPLAELSREIGAVEEKKKGKEYVIVFPDGREVDPEKADLSRFNEEFQILVRKEALGEPLPPSEPKLLKFLNRFGFSWELYSDYGHMRFGPHACIIFNSVSEYSRMINSRLDIPVYEVKGTAFFDLKVDAVKEHAELYGDRLYMIETDKGKMVLRYAACHQQFAMIKDWNISYRNLPFAAFEIADSYRLEQSGEAELCFRLRRFYMPDTHVFVRDEEEAKKWLLRIHDIIMDEIAKLGRNYELLINVVSLRQYSRYKDFIVEIARKVGKPVLVAIYPELGLNYYWTINIEYHIIDVMGRPREIGTVQIDIGNSKRFNITYVDEKGEKKYPIILHTAIIGSIERYIFALFDTALRKKKPMLPVWASPIQVRVIPVSAEYLDYAIEIANSIEAEGFRVDVDDTDRPLGRKILDGEKEWIPYIVIVGEKEVKRETISVRIRENGSQKEMNVRDLIKILYKKVEGYPIVKSRLPKFLSKRVQFIS